MDEGVQAAHIDESGARLPTGERLYVISSSLTVSTRSSLIKETLRSLVLPGRQYLRHYEETLDRKLKIASCVAGLALEGAIVAATACANEEQEDARRRLLNNLLPRLLHVEGVTRVVIESRGGSDTWDRRTVQRLRQSRHLTSALKVDHVPKTVDPLLWIPDLIAGCWVGAHYHGETEPWRVLNEAHPIEVHVS